MQLGQELLLVVFCILKLDKMVTVWIREFWWWCPILIKGVPFENRAIDLIYKSFKKVPSYLNIYIYLNKQNYTDSQHLKHVGFWADLD